MSTGHWWLLFGCQVVQLFATSWNAACQPSLSVSPRACSDSCPLSWWCYPTISSCTIPFSFCLQSFPASGSFLMSWLFVSGGQSIGASVSVSVILMKPLEPKPNTTASASGLRPPWLLPGQKVLQTGGSDWKYYSIEPVSTHFPLDDKKSKRII